MKYPNVTVKLSELDGDTFSILGACVQAAREAGIPELEVRKFKDEALSGDYDHLLKTVSKWFNVI